MSGENTGSSQILFISYDSGHSGAVTSEWVNDKLRVFEASKQQVVLLTGRRSSIESSELVHVVKSNSLSCIDFSEETRQERIDFSLALSWLVANTLGRLFDFIFKGLAGSHSHGKWSWVMSAFPRALYICYARRIQTVFCTGGPSSAHLVGLLVKLLRPKVKLFVELQDPLIGSEMIMSERAMVVLTALERSLVRLSNRIVYVTGKAAARARDRHRTLVSIDSISAIYPGAWDFSIRRSETHSVAENIVFLHSGTLYSNRNLDLFFCALDELKNGGNDLAKRVIVINQGNLAVDNPDFYKHRRDFVELPMAARVESLKAAVNANFLLLVQHKDTRSEETIPYKTYDYLNLGVPIFGLTRNEELEEMIKDEGGFFADNSDFLSIKKELERALSSALSSRSPSRTMQRFNITTQFSKIFA